MNEEWKKWYLAGLWDGDGSFGITKHYSHNQYHKITGKKWTSFQPIAHITLCDSKSKDVFKILEEEFGFNRIRRIRQSPKHRIPLKWYLQSSKACEFAKMIEPYLIIKKERAQILIQWVNKKRGNYSMTEEERIKSTQKQEELYQQMKILNKRGT